MDVHRRGTVIEEAAEGLLEHQEIVEKQKKKKTPKDHLFAFGKSIYNHELREFVGRDGKAWCLLGFFYFFFYLILSGFFILNLYLFSLTLDDRVPTFYSDESTMAIGGLSPALGFRPQYDPESNLIKVDDTNDKLLRSMDIFLSRYDELKDEVVSFRNSSSRTTSFNYNTIIKDTPCAREKNFGYDDVSPCVILKINRIYGWTPEYYDVPPEEALPIDRQLDEEEKRFANATKFLFISCEGEYEHDKDQLNGEIDYYSEFPSKKIGGIKINHFPYLNQENYLSPLVFAHFGRVPKNVLVKVRCKLWAKNVDNTDNYNLKGMTEFDFYVESKKNKTSQ